MTGEATLPQAPPAADLAAGELGSGVYFNPVAPEAAARALRDA